MVNKLI